MYKILPNTKVWFFNEEVGHVGCNQITHLLHQNLLSESQYISLMNNGYSTKADKSFCKLLVLEKAISKKDRELFLELRDKEAYNNVINYLTKED